jgi:hypothetical protein
MGTQVEKVWETQMYFIYSFLTRWIDRHISLNQMAALVFSSLGFVSL